MVFLQNKFRCPPITGYVGSSKDLKDLTGLVKTVAMVRRARRRENEMLAGVRSEEARIGREGMSPKPWVWCGVWGLGCAV